MKKALISGALLSLILLVGCNGEQQEGQVEQEVEAATENAEKDAMSNLLSELKNEIIVSITEETELESESLAIMLGGGAGSIDVSVGFPKNSKVDDTIIQQIVEDSIKSISESENVTISEENITIKIERF